MIRRAQWDICRRLGALAAAALVSTQVMALDDVTREWRFQVSLDGRPIGEHHFVLRGEDERRELTSEARFRVRILFFDAYRYEHRAREWWNGNCLERLEARTTTNGEQVAISGERTGDEFRVLGGGASAGFAPCVQTFAYWNPRILDARRLLNPQTGEYVPVRVIDLGPDALAGHADAERFRLVGATADGTPLEIDLWYSPAREWLALESRTPDGRRLRYSRE